jgi:hypothetical protein
MTRRRLVVLFALVAVVVLPVSPLLIPRRGVGWEPLRHRYDTYQACNELMVRPQKGIHGGGPIFPLRWWNLLGWKGRLDESGSGVAYTWDWWSSMDTSEGPMMVYSICTVESGRHATPGEPLQVDSTGTWSLLQGMQTPLGEDGMPAHSFGELCLKYPEKCR